MIVETKISYWYVDLLTTFFRANELTVKISARPCLSGSLCNIEFDDNSDTANGIMFMSVKNLGLENMLCDYLIKCGIPPQRITLGRATLKRDMKQLDEECNVHLRSIGFH